MSNLNPQVLVLCSSRLALPALFFLHTTKNLRAVLCCTRDFEFEDELKYHAKQSGFSLVVAKQHNWEEKLKSLLDNKPDVVLVKTFGFKIPESFLKIPKHGFINFHYALLPEYRGSFPLFHVLKRQDAYGGVSVHQMTTEFDKGPLLFKQYVPINSPETYGKHFANLSNAAVVLTKQLLEMIGEEDSVLRFVEQDESMAKVIPKLNSNDLIIHWNRMSAEEIVSLILASNHWSKGAITSCGQQIIHVLYARILSEKHTGKIPGTILYLNEGEGVKVACIDYCVVTLDTVFIPYGYLPAFELKQLGLKEGDAFGQ